MKPTTRQPNPSNKEQKEPNSVRETKGLDIGGDGSKLPATPMQEPDKLRTRDFRITFEIFEKFRYTQGCAGCEVRLLGTEHRTHTAACGNRFEENIRKDVKMQQTFNRRDMRTKKPAPSSEDESAQHHAQSTSERVGLIPAPEVSESGSDDEMRDATSTSATREPMWNIH